MHVLARVTILISLVLVSFGFDEALIILDLFVLSRRLPPVTVVSYALDEVDLTLRNMRVVNNTITRGSVIFLANSDLKMHKVRQG